MSDDTALSSTNLIDLFFFSNIHPITACLWFRRQWQAHKQQPPLYYIDTFFNLWAISRVQTYLRILQCKSLSVIATICYSLIIWLLLQTYGFTFFKIHCLGLVSVCRRSSNKHNGCEVKLVIRPNVVLLFFFFSITFMKRKDTYLYFNKTIYSSRLPSSTFLLNDRIVPPS